VINNLNGGGTEWVNNNSGGGNVSALGAGGLAFGTFTGAVGSEVVTERMRIDAGGSMGIGTLTPSSYSNNPILALSRGGAFLDIDNTAASNGSGLSFYQSGTNKGEIFSGGASYASWGGAGSININNYATGGPIAFATSSSERMRISSTGDVQIGTSVDAGNTLRYLDVQNTNVGTSAGAIIRLITNNAAGSATTTVDIVKYKNGQFVLNNNDSAGYTTFGTAGAERMRITSTGNVGINTTSVATGTMLAVAGGNISLYGSTSGVINLAAPAVAGTNTITFPAASGTVLLSSTAGITTGTAITPTSGTTAVLATGLPSTIKRITIQFYNIVMATAASDLIVQLGTSGGSVNTGYSSSGTYVTNASGVGFASASNGMIIAKLTNQATQTLYGAFVLTTVGGNIWVGTGISDNTQNTLAGSLGGYISLGGALTQLQISTISGTPTFSSGTFNILYE
jgi:hypothetical protein